MVKANKKICHSHFIFCIMCLPNSPIYNYSGTEPPPSGATSFPVFWGTILAIGHFQVQDIATVVHQVIYIATQGYGTYNHNYLKSPNPWTKWGALGKTNYIFFSDSTTHSYHAFSPKNSLDSGQEHLSVITYLFLAFSLLPANSVFAFKIFYTLVIDAWENFNKILRIPAKLESKISGAD